MTVGRYLRADRYDIRGACTPTRKRVLIVNAKTADRAMADAKVRRGEAWDPALVVPPKDCVLSRACIGSVALFMHRLAVCERYKEQRVSRYLKIAGWLLAFGIAWFVLATDADGYGASPDAQWHVAALIFAFGWATWAIHVALPRLDRWLEYKSSSAVMKGEQR